MTFLQSTGLVIATCLLIVGAAWLGRAYGKRIRGGALLGFFMFGFGEVIDPPARHAAESSEKEADTDVNGEPKD